MFKESCLSLFLVILKAMKFILQEDIERKILKYWVQPKEDLLNVVGCSFKSNNLLVGPGTIHGMPSVGIFLWHPILYLREFQRKPQENSERLGRQAQPGIEPGTSHLPILSAEPLHH